MDDTNENVMTNSAAKMRMASQIQVMCGRIEDQMKKILSDNSAAEFYESALRLCLIFDEELVIEGMTIAENGLIRIVRDEEGLFPPLYEVRTGSFCSNSYYSYDSINFCKCQFFTSEGNLFAYFKNIIQSFSCMQ